MKHFASHPKALLLALAAGAIAASAVGIGVPAASGRFSQALDVKNILNPFDYFSNSWALVGLKDYPDATRISPQGEFLLGADVTCQFLVGEPLSSVDNSVRKTLVKGYLPIVQYDFTAGAVEYVVEAFACPMPGSDATAYDFPADPNFLTMLRMTMRNRAGSPARGAVGLRWKTPSLPVARELAAGRQWKISLGDALRGVVTAGPGLDSRAADGGRLEFWADLGPGAARSVVFRLPFYPIPDQGDVAAGLTRPDFDECKGRTASFWEDLLGRGAKLYVPEDKPLCAYRASIVYQFIGRDKAELHAGEGFYDEPYLRDGAYQAISLAHAGYLDAARRSLEFFAGFQQENGQFVSQKGQLDGNGYAVWALAEYGRLSHDNIWALRYYPAILRSVAFIRAARALETDPDSPFAGILPRAPADGENLWAGTDHIVGYDLWNLRAVQSAAEAARQLAKIDDMRALEAEFEDYKAAILRALDRTGLPYMPPSYEKEGTPWGNLEAIFPTVLIDPMDRRVSATLDEVRESFGNAEGAKAGLIEGLVQWTPKTRAIHPYLSLFLTNSHIVRAEQEKAVDGFYSFLLHSTSTQGFPEGVYYEKREAWGDTIPHLWAAALYVTTLRDMLVREHGQDLHLFSAVPSAWLEPGKAIVFENAPTRFGRMSLSAEAQAGAVIVRFTRPDRMDPDRLIIHLPPDLEITEVGRCGKSVKMSLARDVLIPGWNLREGNIVNICVRRKAGAPHPDFAAKLSEFLASGRKDGHAPRRP